MRVISFLKVLKELDTYFGIILIFFEMRRNQYIRNVLFILLFFLNAHLFGQTFIIGTGSFGTGAIPISTGSPYSYSQSIYQSNLMTSQGMSPGMSITSLAWYVNAPNPSISNASWTVYLANSTQSSFTSTTSWIADSLFTQVFTGTVIPSPAGWKTINLATPFVWNGSNLVIAVDENSPGNSPSPNLFLRTYLDYSTNVSIFKENNIDIIPSSLGNATGLLLDYPNIRIGICWPTPPSAITASGPTTFCAGSSVNLITNSGAGYTYQWKNNGVSIAGATSQIYSATSSGNYTVNVTNFSGCSATSSATMVTVNGPVAGTVSGNQTICAGTSPANITLSGNTGTIQWQVSTDNITFTNIIGATSSPLTSAQMGSLTVTSHYRAVVNSGACASVNSSVVTATVSPISVAGTVSTNQTICTGAAPANITLSGNTGTIQWQGSGDNIMFNNIIGATASSLNSAQIGSLTSTSFYRAFVTSGVCPSVNSSAVMVTVTINAVPTVSAGSNQTLCLGSPVTLNGTGATSYYWNNGVVNGVAFIPNATQTYTVSGTDAFGCTNTAQVTVVVNALPTVSAGSNQTTCSGSPVNLSGTGATSYSWNNGVINGIAFTPIATQTYTVTGTDTNSCTNTAQVTVAVNALPSVSAGPNQTVCGGSPVTLNGAGATSYSWNNGITNGVSFTPTNTQTYTVSGTDANGCTNTAQVQVSVNALPTLSAGVNQTVCAGTSVTLSGTGATSYIWNNGITNAVAFTLVATQNYTVTGTDANGCVNTAQVQVVVNALPSVSAGLNQTICAGSLVTLNGSGAVSYTWNNNVQNGVAFTPATPQTYTVSGTDANGCTNTAQVQVSVNALPSVSAGLNQTICAGSLVTLNGSGAVSYSWNNNVQNGVAFTPTTNQTYTVSGTDSNGCTNTAQVQVSVNALPTVSAGANQTVCVGTSVTLSGTGATSYIWNNGITNAVAFTPVATQNYTVTGTNMNGCVNAAQVQVVVNALPTVSAGANQTVCAGTSVTLSGTGATSYIWNNGINNAVAFTPLATQNYTITGTDANGCVNTAQVQVTVNALPTVSAGVDQTVFAGTQVTLSGVGAATYSWNNGVINNTPFTANVTTTYTLTGTTNSCTATDQVLVNVLTAPSIGATNSTICLGQNTTISATAPNSGTPCASTGLQGTLTNGLVGYWPFCGNANDASQNGNNGTVNGATLTADRFGAASNAYSFNGNSRIDVGTLNTQIGGSNSSWSVQCWFKSNGSLNGDMVLVTDYSSNTNSDQVVSTWLALWSFTFNNKVGSALRNIPNGWDVLSINPYNDNQWHSMVSVSELGLLKLYIDGILINTINYNNNTNFIGSPYFRFGALLFNGQLDSYFQGQLDDIGIWNRALTQQEITQLYQQVQATYSWSNGATTPSITVSPTQTTTYTCAISMDGASTTQSQTIIVNSPSSSILTQSACDEFEAPDGQIYNNSGQYNAVLSNYLGCDSNIVINLQVNPSYNVWNTITACDSYTWIDGNTYNTSNNNATYTFTSLDGCDSTIHLDLNLGNTPDTVQINASAINLYSLNGIEYNQNGTYYQLFTNQYGCDSVIMLTLAFEHTGLQVLNNSLQVFPNPSSDGIFYICSEGINDYEIYDMIGRKVPFEWYEGRLNMSMLPKGHYLFEANKMKGYKIVIRISIQ
jgi:hypothetical protein